VREAERLTLDEVQRQPDLLRAIKRAVDERRLPGRFLLTGSANLLLMRQVSETLAGRAVYLRLSPLSEAEKLGAGRFGAWDLLLGAASAQEAEAALSSRAATEFTWSAAAYEGGYPPVLSLGETDRARWLEGYVTTYLERDLQQLASITELADFRRFLQVAAGRLGGIVNRADLARDADLSRPTAHRYLNLLDVSFQTRLLPAYAASRTTRLVKSPKLYWTDTGLAAYLAGFASAEEVRQDPRRGPLLENLILKEIDAWRESATPKPEVYYWRISCSSLDAACCPSRSRPRRVRGSRMLRRSRNFYTSTGPRTGDACCTPAPISTGSRTGCWRSRSAVCCEARTTAKSSLLLFRQAGSQSRRVDPRCQKRVIPAKAGIQGGGAGWTPAFAGVTEWANVGLLSVALAVRRLRLRSRPGLYYEPQDDRFPAEISGNPLQLAVRGWRLALWAKAARCSGPSVPSNLIGLLSAMRGGDSAACALR
jgi:hypothetical protein